ncbi:Uncharacterized protein pbN1_32160 [Aromatoleum bremense]|nr:Uncharacterized protein pbN1_32160 [Aromatoleum bremense]
MKINPFSKKSTAYYDKVKADYDKLHAELMRIPTQRDR